MEHTPGPWTVEPSPFDGEGFASLVVDATGEIIAENMTEANARLIAAAPDLLAALQAIDALNDGALMAVPTTHPVFEAARDAIAMATGEDR